MGAHEESHSEATHLHDEHHPRHAPRLAVSLLDQEAELELLAPRVAAGVPRVDEQKVRVVGLEVAVEGG